MFKLFFASYMRLSAILILIKRGAHRKFFDHHFFNLKSKFCHCVAYTSMIQDAFKSLRRYHQKNELVARWRESILHYILKREEKMIHAVKDQNILEYTNIERFITILNHAISFR